MRKIELSLFEIVFTVQPLVIQVVEFHSHRFCQSVLAPGLVGVIIVAVVLNTAHSLDSRNPDRTFS